MKKQVISFLALFGLVFVLSVYYVLLPTNLFIKANNNININDNNDIQVGYTIEESSNLYFASLDTKLKEKHDTDIFNLENIIASSSIENQEKEAALNSLNNKNKIIANEEYLVSLIKEAGYYNAFVEYQDNIIKVIVQAESLTNIQAANIISIVMDNAIGTTSLLPEIEYVS